MRCCLIARLGKSLDEINALPFPTVVGLFKHWAEEPPLEVALAAMAGFKKAPKKMSQAEEEMLQDNAKSIDLSKLPPAFQMFVQKSRKAGEKVN